AFEIGGRATFKIGGARGFRLPDFRLNELKIFDFSLSLPGNKPQDCPPTPDLNLPTDNGLVHRNVLDANHYIDVTYNAYNGVGISTTSINGDEFRVFLNGSEIPTNSLSFQTPVLRFGTTYRYNFTGSFPTNGDYAIVFQGGSFSDTALHTNVAVTKHFTATTPPVGDPVGPNGPPRGPPVARLTNP